MEKKPKHPNSLKNLIRFDDMTPERLKEVATRAGKASVIKKRRIKTLRGCFDMLMKCNVDEEVRQNILNKFSDTKDIYITYMVAMFAGVIEKAVSGDVNAFKSVLEYAEKNDLEKFEQATIINDISKMPDEC